ncbi:MAG: YdcF family protein [Deltaproteobacteria bacterium]|nr:YdcF family protein [Deltaproteobacteria bacterium]
MDYNKEAVQEKTDELGIPEKLDKRKKVTRFSIYKLLLFLFIALYFVVTFYRIPLLTALGRYLIVEHEPEKADVIVCLAGKNIERSLAVVDAYRKGLAPYIFMAKKSKPDGFDYLQERIKNYPADFDLFKLIMEGFQIPEKVILSQVDRVDNTLDEVRSVHKFVLERGFKSLIVITSLTHSRRAWLTFTKVFKDDGIKIISLPSHYQLFNPKDWWKKRKRIEDLILEYQKLIYYKIAYLV